jgi:hypothetical protein
MTCNQAFVARIHQTGLEIAKIVNIDLAMSCRSGFR